MGLENCHIKLPQCTVYGIIDVFILILETVPDCRHLSHLMRKLKFCICENIGADQLRSNCEADQRHCIHYMDRLNAKFQASNQSSSVLCTAPSVSDMFENHIVGFLMR